MTKSLSCKDAGANCSWSATAESEEDLMAKAAEHVKSDHKEIEMNPQTVAKIKSLIKEI